LRLVPDNFPSRHRPFKFQTDPVSWSVNCKPVESFKKCKVLPSTIWISGRMQEQLTDAAASSIKEPEQQAKFIFNHLDLDSSGMLELAEIELLLMEWGMDAEEVERYLKKFGGADGKIDFQEFYTGMKPVWRFGFSEIFN